VKTNILPETSNLNNLNLNNSAFETFNLFNEMMTINNRDRGVLLSRKVEAMRSDL